MRLSLRPPVAGVLAGVLVLSGCGLFGGEDRDASSAPTSSTAKKNELKRVGYPSVKASKVARGGTLRLATEALPKNFNPLHSSNDETDIDRLLEPTNGSAVRITADGGWEVDPNYATSIEVDDKDPLTIKVELNPDAVWQDGSSIDAKDMIASWKALNGSEEPYEVFSTEGYEDIASIEQGDDKFSYAVTFEDPTVDWPRYVYPSLPSQVASSAKKFNNDFTDKTIPSNGPFLTRSIDRKTGRVVQVANPRWWGDKPRLKSVTWQAATEETQLAQLKSDDLDAVDVVARPAQKISGTTLLRSRGTEWTQITMNGASGPLKDKKVRRAIALALDRKALATESSRGVGAPAEVLGSFILLPGQAGYTDLSDLIAPDVAEARDLLDDAGWKVEGTAQVRSRKGKELELRMPVASGSPTNRARVALIAKQLAEVGIVIKQSAVDNDDFFSQRIVPLDFDLATFSHTGGPFPVVDARALFYPIDSAQNFTGVEDDELAGAWDKGIAALDDAERNRVVKVLDRRLFRDVPIIPLAVTPEATVVRTGVANYGPAEFARPDWTKVGFLATKK